MSKTNEPEPTSGFVKPAEIVKSEDFTDYTNIPSRGVFQLTRAKRHGRWWMLKGLKEQYRQDSIYRAFLEKEFEIASQLQHPLVVSVYSLEDVKVLGPVIVMEWIEGTTLKDWLADGGNTRKQRRHIAEMLLEALKYVHSRQTQHRDLKPSNIMVTHSGQYLKLIDFGFSDTDSHAVLKAPAGTEGYMAPEGPSDIYSLGIILRELNLGWASSLVAKKCCAPLHRRYHDISTIQRDLHQAWHWPRRILFTAVIGILAAILFQFNISHTQQGLQSVSDSLEAVRKESNTMISFQKAKSDSIEQQMRQMNQEHQAEQQSELHSEQQPERQSELVTEYEEEQEAVLQRERRISEAMKQIDARIKELHIEEIMDTLSCQLNVPIPIISIFDKMENEAEYPEVKEYIRKRYRTPCMKRFFSLPLK